jgi:thiol:disulfide interchange protein
MSLTVKALLGLFFLAVAVSLLLFVAAGTMDYRQGWQFLVVFMGASLSDHALSRQARSGVATAD